MLKCFMAVAETLNFTKAAQSLFLTQQAVSRNVSALEEELGMKLVIRDTHSVKLSPCGEIYYQEIRRMYSEYIHLVGELRSQFGDQTKILNLGVVDSPDFYRFLQAFHDYQKTQPDGFSLRVIIEPPDKLQEKLISRELDAILTMNCFITEGEIFESWALAPVKMRLCVAKKNRLFKKDSSWERYQNEPLILHVEAGKNIYAEDNFMNRMVKNLGLKPSAIIILPNVDQMLNMVKDGRGVMLCTESNPLFNQPEIALFDLPKKDIHYVFARRKDSESQISHKADTFSEYLSQWQEPPAQ